MAGRVGGVSRRPEEFLDVGDSVVVMVRYWGRGKGSGVEVHDRGRAKTSGVDIEEMYAKGAAMFHVRDGKVTRLALYWEREHALADVGVKE